MTGVLIHAQTILTAGHFTARIEGASAAGQLPPWLRIVASFAPSAPEFRRLRIRYGKRADIHEAFLSLGCAVICWARAAEAMRDRPPAGCVEGGCADQARRICLHLSIEHAADDRVESGSADCDERSAVRRSRHDPRYPRSRGTIDLVRSDSSAKGDSASRRRSGLGYGVPRGVDDRARFHPVAPVWAAPVDVDDKKAWDGSRSEQPDPPFHIEAGAYHGRIDWFRIFGPWDAPVPLREPPQPTLKKVSLDVAAWVFDLLLVPAIILAIRNLRRGRGDRRAALRLAWVITVTTVIALLFRADHTAGPEALALAYMVLARSVLAGALAWLLYMALEPYVRRNLPHTLIGWTRLLAGRVRDPMVGRDVLIGALAWLVFSIAWVDSLTGP